MEAERRNAEVKNIQGKDVSPLAVPDFQIVGILDKHMHFHSAMNDILATNTLLIISCSCLFKCYASSDAHACGKGFRGNSVNY